MQVIQDKVRGTDRHNQGAVWQSLGRGRDERRLHDKAGYLTGDAAPRDGTVDGRGTADRTRDTASDAADDLTGR